MGLAGRLALVFHRGVVVTAAFSQTILSKNPQTMAATVELLLPHDIGGSSLRSMKDPGTTTVRVSSKR